MIETKIHEVGDVTVVEMSGRLHLGNTLMYAENSINGLIDGGTRKLVIGLAGVDYIDSAGLGMLIACGGRMEQSGGHMRIAGSNGRVAKAFQIVHANRILQFDSDIESACRNLAASTAAG